MLWTMLAIAALTGGLLDFCFGQTDLGESTLASGEPGASNAWTTSRFDFAPDPDPQPNDSGGLINAYGGSGTFLRAERGPRPTFETINLEFWTGSPAGFVEYIEKDEVIDCSTGKVVSLPGEAVLLVHFEPAFRDDRFVENSLAGGSMILDARQICDRDGIVEWAIAVASPNPFEARTHYYSERGFNYSVVSIQVLN